MNRCNHVTERERGFTLIEIMVVVLIIGILLTIAMPNFVRSRQTARVKSCITNLKEINSAKEQWAMDFRKDNDDSPVKSNLTTEGADSGKYLKKWPSCPEGGNYTIERIGESPTCDIAGHML